MNSFNNYNNNYTNNNIDITSDGSFEIVSNNNIIG